MRRYLFYFLISVAIVLSPFGSAHAVAEDLVIAAASDLNFAIKELVGLYEKQTGQHIKLSLGSSVISSRNSKMAPHSICTSLLISDIPKNWKRLDSQRLVLSIGMLSGASCFGYHVIHGSISRKAPMRYEIHPSGRLLSPTPSTRPMVARPCRL